MKLGALEKKVMHIIWKHFATDSFVVRDIVTAMNSTYAYNTILTVTTHLFEKGLLRRKKNGKTFEYTASVSKNEFVNNASRMAVERLRKEYGDIAVAHFAKIVQEIDPKVLHRAAKALKKSQ